MKKYIVGGAVRDELLHLTVTERDWVVLGATPQEMLAQGYQQVGKDFPIFVHPTSREEYALARTERKSGPGYTGFICYTSPEVTLAEDLRRRDLTINAIARDELGNLIDPYHGQHDIRQRCLRHVSDAFSEDPLRVLRVARFAARFADLQFRIAPATLLLMKKMISELPFISPERIWTETKKALVTSNPHVYFQVLHDCGALKTILPEINALFNLPAPIKWDSTIDDIGLHTMKAIYRAACLSQDMAIRFAVLCHNLGHIITYNHRYSIHYGYVPDRSTGVKLVETMCQRLKIPNKLRELAKIVINYHHLLHHIHYLTPKILIKLFNAIDVWRHPERLEQLIIISQVTKHGPILTHNVSSHINLLREAYRIASAVNASKIITEGFNGVQISEELNLRRRAALTMWKQQQEKR